MMCPNASCQLVTKYCPYERMDREINVQLFSMKYFAQILAKFDFDKYKILMEAGFACSNVALKSHRRAVV